MNARKNYHYLLEDINAAKNPLDVENVVFNADILEKARNIFYDVTIFKLDSIGNYIESNDNSGVVVRIHCTDWEYFYTSLSEAHKTALQAEYDAAIKRKNAVDSMSSEVNVIRCIKL